MKNVNEMSLYEICRWAALIEAVDLIHQKCRELNIDMDDKLNSHYIQNYVEQTSDEIYHKFSKKTPFSDKVIVK